MVGGRALGIRVGREAVLCLGDADRDLGEAHGLERGELVLHRLGDGDVAGPVDLLGDGADLFD
jgi:hypothetical protein